MIEEQKKAPSQKNNKVAQKAKNIVTPSEKYISHSELESIVDTITDHLEPVIDEISVHTYDTIVVGAGISGIAAAYNMSKVGYNDYIVLEKASRVGGTWRDNNYPGCGCDVPSALYSFSFSPSHKWSHLFAKQPEILNYPWTFATTIFKT